MTDPKEASVAVLAPPIKIALLMQLQDRSPDLIGELEIPVKVSGDLPNLTISMGTDSLKADLVKLLRDTADEIEAEDDPFAGDALTA